MTRKAILDNFYNTVSQYKTECLESDSFDSYDELLESYGIKCDNEYLLEMDFNRFFSKIYEALKNLLKVLTGWATKVIRFFMKHFKIIFALVTTFSVSSYILIKFGASILKQAREVKTLKDLYDNEKLNIALRDVFNNAENLFDVSKSKSGDMKTTKYLNIKKMEKVFEASHNKILNKVKSIFKIIKESFVVVIKRIYKDKRSIIEDIREDDEKRRQSIRVLANATKYGRKMILIIAKYTDEIAEYLGKGIFKKFGAKVKRLFNDYIKEYNQTKLKNENKIKLPDDISDKLEKTLFEKFSYDGVNALFSKLKSYAMFITGLD